MKHSTAAPALRRTALSDAWQMEPRPSAKQLIRATFQLLIFLSYLAKRTGDVSSC